MARKSVPARFSVTFEVLTDESVEAGDAEDRGWVDPRTEKKRSHVKGGRRVTERHVRMARAGKLDWSLKEAVQWLNDNAGGPVSEAEYEWGGMTLRVSFEQDGQDVIMGRNGYEYDGSKTNYTLHCEGLTVDRAKVVLRALDAPSHVLKRL